MRSQLRFGTGEQGGHPILAEQVDVITALTRTVIVLQEDHACLAVDLVERAGHVLARELCDLVRKQRCILVKPARKLFSPNRVLRRPQRCRRPARRRLLTSLASAQLYTSASLRLAEGGATLSADGATSVHRSSSNGHSGGRKPGIEGSGSWS